MSGVLMLRYVLLIKLHPAYGLNDGSYKLSTGLLHIHMFACFGLSVMSLEAQTQSSRHRVSRRGQRSRWFGTGSLLRRALGDSALPPVCRLILTCFMSQNAQSVNLFASFCSGRNLSVQVKMNMQISCRESGAPFIRVCVLQTTL